MALGFVLQFGCVASFGVVLKGLAWFGVWRWCVVVRAETNVDGGMGKRGELGARIVCLLWTVRWCAAGTSFLRVVGETRFFEGLGGEFFVIFALEGVARRRSWACAPRFRNFEQEETEGRESVRGGVERSRGKGELC